MYFRIEDCIRFSFIPSIVYALAILRTSHNLETIIWSLWWVFVTIFARVTVNHKTLFKQTPGWWENMNARLLYASCVVSILYACNVPYAWLGCFIMRASSYKTLYFIGFIVWSVLMAAGVCTLEYWPVLFLVTAMTKQWAEKERCNPLIYWTRRSIVTALHQEIRYCIWCKAVFPHAVRTDVTVLAWLIMFVVMIHRRIVYVAPKKVFIFTSMPPTHVPAPSIETALECAICKKYIQIDDEERVYTKQPNDVRDKKKKTKKKKKKERRGESKPMFAKPAMKQSGIVYQQTQPRTHEYTQQDAMNFAHQYGAQEPTDDVCDFI